MNSWQAALDARPRLRRAIVLDGPRQLWSRENGPGRNVPLVLLDFHQCRVRNTALGQSRGPFVQGQNVHIAMLVESVDFAWMLRVIPTAFAYQDNAGPNSVGQGSASECLPTAVEDPDYVTMPNSACGCIFGVYPGRLAACDLVVGTNRGCAKLRVNPEFRMRRKEMKRVSPGSRAPRRLRPADSRECARNRSCSCR